MFMFIFTNGLKPEHAIYLHLIISTEMRLNVS